MEKKIVCLTPSLKGFCENIGEIDGVILKESSVSTKVDDIVLLTGSLLDKSEIAYRHITETNGIYCTVLPLNVQLNEVDSYWFENTTVVYKSELISILLALE